ncbi:phosphohydrolase [Geothermobacter hydrogeniphilus]|uniref:Phosphohydrolase n=1 Tax=Geothermobacter hydrogeniphilus TaxID=1969733 RepID=A0A1X0Y1N8_9BACT|nr:phosphohydrolase [Geothermobacter hydrogeniphilus]
MTNPERKPETPVRKKTRDNGVSATLREVPSHNQSLVLLAILALLLTLIIIPKGGGAPAHYAPGDIASRDIKAPRDLLIPDLELTEKKRREAQQAVLPLYDYDPSVGRGLADRLGQVFILLKGGPQDNLAPGSLQPEVEKILGVNLEEKEFKTLVALASQEEIHAALQQGLVKALKTKAVANLRLFQQDRSRGVMVRNLVSNSETELADLTTVVGVGELRNRILAAVKGVAGLKKSNGKVLADLLGRLARPNLTFNKNATEERKRLAAEAVQPILSQVKKGEMIVREGARVSADQVKKLTAVRALNKDQGRLPLATGLLLTIFLLLIVCNNYAERNISKYRLKSRDLFFLVTTFIGLMVLIKLSIFIVAAVDTAFPMIESSSFFYLFPFAAGAMVVRIVLNSEIALVFAALIALVVGFMFGNSLFLSLFTLVGSLTGAHWVRHCNERSTLYRAGWHLSLINMATVVGLHLLGGHQLDLQLLYKLGFAFGGGIFSAIVVTAAVPLVETVFKYTTDIKLLELANLNTPVLRQLMVQAPGTYHHSIVVGNLAEAGAEAIRANPLLARVAAYYHDIGKIKKPLYFVENQSGSENRHDKLTPSMSALVLMAHVKDGVELARENRLGDALIDILRQHHGTALMKFFYDKAKNQQDPDVQQVDERDYRYPGPKPQTREAALIMLADAVEAAGRTLADPTPARIQGMVQKIINNIFIDGQLDECELTLKDLHNIAKSFNRILAGIFHYRIDYPEPVHKEKDQTKKKNGDHTDRESGQESADRSGHARKGSAEDLKRLGMS